LSPVTEGKLRLGGMALRNGLLVHGPTHWAAAVRTKQGDIKVASGPKPRVTIADDIPGLAAVRRSVATPIAADQTVYTPGELRLGGAHRLAKLCVRGLPGRRLALEELEQERQILSQRLGAGANLSPQDRAEIRRHEDLEALLARRPLADVRVQELRQRVEQLGRIRAVLSQWISSRRSHSGSQIWRPSDASS